MARRAIPLAESFVDLRFPLAGLDFFYGLDRQPTRQLPGGVYARTAIAGTNVLGFESIAFRCRGGSRPGLTRWADTLSGPVTNLITIVYTDTGSGPQA